MPKKKFEAAEEDARYDPFAAEGKRAAIRAATGHFHEEAAGGGGGAVVMLPRHAEPEPKSPVRASRDGLPEPSPAAIEAPGSQGNREAPEPPRSNSAPEQRAPSIPRLEKTTEAAALTSSVPRQTVQKRFRVSPVEEEEFETFVLRLRQASSSKVDFSVISRALWAIVQHAEAQVLDELKRVVIPARPGTHAHLEIAEYEELWTQVLVQALRRMPPIKSK